MTITQIVLTSGTSWTVPDDWNNDDVNSTIDALEAGQDGVHGGAASKSTQGVGGDGGGGGLLSRVTNFQANPGDTLTINIGAAGASPGATWLSNTGVAPTSTSEGVKAAASGAVGDETHAGQAGAPDSGLPTPTSGGDGGDASTLFDPGWDGIAPGTGGAGGPEATTNGGKGGDGQDGTLYGGGGGGGGGGKAANGSGGAQGLGQQGVIVIRYTPKATSSGPQFRAYVI